MMQRTSNPILHRLQQTLETYAPREEVAEALKAAEALGDELPPLLAFRASERIEADRFLGRRRMFFGVLAALFLFVTAFSAVGLTTVTRMRLANRDAATLRQLLDDEQWDEAEAFLDSLAAETLQRQEFKRGRQQIDEARDRERRRVAEFQAIVSELRSNPTRDIDRDAVDRLDELAVTDQERAIAAEMSAKADEQQLRRQSSRVDDQTRQFEQLQRDVDDFLENESEGMDDQARVFRTRQLQRQLQQFVSANHLSNPELTEAAKQTAALLSREDQRAQVRSQRQHLIDAVTQSVGDTNQFLRGARRLAEAFPSDPMGQELGDLQAGPIEATQAWIDVLTHPAWLQPASADSQQSAQWLTRLDAAVSIDAHHPLGRPASRWRDHYQAIARRGQAIQRLRELFQSSWLIPVYVYRDADGSRYYSDAPPQRDSPTAHVIEYFTDLSLVRETKNFGTRYRQQVLPHVRMAGHCGYAAKASRAVAAMNDSDFTPGVYRLLSELRALNTETEIDPILKLDLMRRLLEIGTSASVPLQRGFGDWSSELEASGFAWETNWMSPGDALAQVADARRVALELLRSGGDWDQRVKGMGESYQDFRQPRTPPPTWVGWVTRQDDKFVVLLKAPPGPGRLVAITPDPESDTTTLVELGTSPPGFTLDIEDPAAHWVGAPVCLLPAVPEDQPGLSRRRPSGTANYVTFARN